MDFKYTSKLTAFDRVILCTTVLIFPAGYVIFPLGLVIALIRVFSTHFHRSCKGRNHRLLGWAFTLTYLVTMFIFLITYDEFGPAEAAESIANAVVYGALLLLPAFIFFSLIGPSDRNFNRLLSQYHWLVMERGITSVRQIALETRQSPIPAERDLNFMINHRMLPVGVIENGVIRFMPGSYPFEQQAEPSEEAHPQPGIGNHENPDMRGPRALECPGCGARVVVAPHEQKECEYCGNVIICA